MKKEKEKREFWWLLWGIITAFVIQVVYDGFGLYGPDIKFIAGVLFASILLAILAGYIVLIYKKAK